MLPWGLRLALKLVPVSLNCPATLWERSGRNNALAELSQPRGWEGRVFWDWRSHVEGRTQGRREGSGRQGLDLLLCLHLKAASRSLWLRPSVWTSATSRPNELIQPYHGKWTIFSFPTVAWQYSQSLCWIQRRLSLPVLSVKQLL